MNWALAGGLIICGSILLLALAWLAIRLLRYRNAEETDHEDFVAARYEPLLRLAKPDDMIFLSSLPGYRPEIGKRFRQERALLFRMYLRELSKDFHLLHAKARKMVAESPEPHAELVGVLMRQELRFLGALALIELRLVVHRAELPQIDVSGLLASVDAMRMDLTRITAL